MNSLIYYLSSYICCSGTSNDSSSKTQLKFPMKKGGKVKIKKLKGKGMCFVSQFSSQRLGLFSIIHMCAISIG